ncbi:D-beta-hydroxybutyrate dehydrogenase, mitochondrial-like [Periplaneta americana]|uniref:D-beta-hydroxybutyrate dehydrogenase, mitochondrial-like n=1 Tax=Periplaneta americana TaxID=6978 RepID=UPI0037E94AE9
MDFSLDGVYRAVVRGLQVGVGLIIILWLSNIIVGLFAISTCTVFIFGTLLGTAATFYQDTMEISLEGKAVVVTGCDTGFGHALALRLEKLGAVVFAGCLKSQEGGAKQLADKGLTNLHVVQMDITSDEEMRTALDYVTSHLPPQGLWGIVNNAGWSTFGHVEWVPIPICRKSLEVNVWGMMRVIRTFLPLIRQSKGRIVNMSSGMGRRCAPSRASYCITKYGVEALSDCLRFEMRRWDVNVVIVEPGNFVNATGVFTPDSIRRDAAALWKQIPEEIQKDYTKEYFDGLVEKMIMYSTLGTTDKEPVLEALTKALVHQYPHPRYQPMELYFKLSVWINTHLPEWVFEKLFT